MKPTSETSAPNPASPHILSLFWVTTLLGAGLDLWSKAWAENLLRPLPDHTLAVIAPWLELSLACNRGTAFGVVSDLGVLRLVFGVLALAVVAALFWMVWQDRRDRWQAGAFGILAAGALGNGVDRVFRTDGGGGTCVIDFVKVNYPWGGSWPTFNVADAWLVIGVAMLLWSMVGRWRQDRAASRPG